LRTVGRGMVAAALVLLPAAGLAACGGDSGSALKTVTVTASDSGFSPSTVNLDKPGKYTFHEVNNGTRPIALDIEGNGVDQDATPADPGKTTDLTVDLGTGTYDMHSQDDGADRSHEIKGSVVVKGG
jgi:plastocyanin